MKNKKLSALLILVATPLAMFASSATDRKIEEAAKASYNYRTVLEDRVKVKADEGVVTLSGSVSDKEDKALAEDTVENLPGVLSVKNEIKIESTFPEKSDNWMAMKIRSRLLTKSNVSATNTKVTVNGGNVILTGTAKNAAQKELTEAYAKDVDGVLTVKNEIVVTENYSAKSTEHSKDHANYGDETMGAKMDDASITGQVKMALLTHKSTSALKTKVTTKDGVVRVTGDANSAAEKSLVTKLAQDVRGTKSVTNDMTVKKAE